MGWLYVAAAAAAVVCLLFTFRIYAAHREARRVSWADTTHLKAYLIIYDMKRKSSFNAKYAEEIYYTI